MKNDSITADELIALAQRDLSLRQSLSETGQLSPGYHPDMERLHNSNAARLAQIIDAMGYPTCSKVGSAASEAAWLIVQHAISKPDFMKRCYALICQASGDVDPKHQAYLYDRLCYFEGKPQRYGTQFDSRGLYPVADKNEMIRLREKLGLSAINEDEVTEISQPDEDLHPDDEEFNNWRRKVGWI